MEKNLVMQTFWTFSSEKFKNQSETLKPIFAPEKADSSLTDLLTLQIARNLRITLIKRAQGISLEKNGMLEIIYLKCLKKKTSPRNCRKADLHTILS